MRNLANFLPRGRSFPSSKERRGEEGNTRMAKDTSNVSRLITTNGDAFPRSRFLSISRPKEGGREIEGDEGYSRGCSPISFPWRQFSCWKNGGKNRGRKVGWKNKLVERNSARFDERKFLFHRMNLVYIGQVFQY